MQSWSRAPDDLNTGTSPPAMLKLALRNVYVARSARLDALSNVPVPVLVPSGVSSAKPGRAAALLGQDTPLPASHAASLPCGSTSKYRTVTRYRAAPAVSSVPSIGAHGTRVTSPFGSG